MPVKSKIDIIGKRFSRLLCLEFVPTSGSASKFLFRCDCGAEKIIFASSVTRGITKSCGCFQRDHMADAFRTHGQTSGGKQTRTYKSWVAMLSRCERPGTCPGYEQYGAQGIRVDPEWHNFEQFYKDMGDRPANTSIDRIDGEKGYSKDNCRWATRIEQNRNMKSNNWVNYEGVDILVIGLCEKLGISNFALRARASRRKNDYVSAFISMGISCAPRRKT